MNILRKYKVLTVLAVFILSIAVCECQKAATVYVNIYCKSEQDINIVLYSDNGSKGDSWDCIENGIVKVLTGSSQIQSMNYEVPRGSENSIKICFGSDYNTNIDLQAVEVYYNHSYKRVEAKDIPDNFIISKADLTKGEDLLHIESTEKEFYVEGTALGSSRRQIDMHWRGLLWDMAVAFLASLVLIGLYGWQYVMKNVQLVLYQLHKEIWIDVVVVFFSAVCISAGLLIFENSSLDYLTGNPLDVNVKIYFFNCFFVMWAILLIKNVINLKAAVVLTALAAVLIEVINYFMIVLRGENFAPWSIVLAREAAGVVSLGELPWSSSMVIFLMLFAALAAFLWPLHSRYMVKSRLVGKTMKVVLLLGIGIWCWKGYIKNNIFSIQQFAVAQSYHQSGTMAAFMYFCQNAKIEEPDGYNQKYMEQLAQDIESEVKRDKDDEHGHSGIKPNIIMIMSESFWDPQIMPGLSYSKDFMKDYRQICEKGSSGSILSPHFGGGTCDVEFEALTGFTIDYIQSNLMPYVGIIKNEFFSIAQYLADQGYTTVGMHPYSVDYYNRINVWKYLGFQRTIFQGEFEPDIVRGWLISDDALKNKMIETYLEHQESSDNPQFIFAVTMQNHQPYGGGYEDDEAVKFESENLNEDALNALIDFSTGVDYSSLALGDLIEFFEGREEPVIVIYWGDHMCSLGAGQDSVPYASGYISENCNADFLLYQTPIVVWDNYLHMNKKLKTMSTFQILPTVFDLYDLEMPAYFSFLLRMQQKSLGISHHSVLLDAEGNPCEDVGDTDLIYKDMRLIQYDYIYGRKYCEDLFH